MASILQYNGADRVLLTLFTLKSNSKMKQALVLALVVSQS